MAYRCGGLEAAFETWRPPGVAAFDLVFAATAWHWIDPAVKYRRAWDLLRPGGHLAFWAATHVFPAGGDPFFRDIQDVYHEIGEGLPPGSSWPQPGELPDDTAEIESSGLFEHVTVRQFDWESATAPSTTSGCSTPSRATSPWTRGNVTACTARSGVASLSGLMAACDGIGERSCKLGGAARPLTDRNCSLWWIRLKRCLWLSSRGSSACLVPRRVARTCACAASSSSGDSYDHPAGHSGLHPPRRCRP
jgi:hypothetical protein